MTMADHRNSPLMFVPMRSDWGADRINLLRADPKGLNPTHSGQAIAAALFHALTPAAFAALIAEAQRLTKRT